MQLSDKTISILKSFANINRGIVVKKGNVLRTVDTEKTILAKATLDQEFPADFSIFELSKFLGMISLRKTPDVIFKENYLLISEGTHRTKFQYSAPEVIVHSDKELKLPSVDASFFVSKTDLDEILKAQRLLGGDIIMAVGDGEKIMLRASPISDDQSHEIEVGVTTKKFKAVFEAEYFKLILNDYNVEITSAGYARFSNDKEGLEYFICLHSEKSQF